MSESDYSVVLFRHYVLAWGNPAYEARWLKGRAQELPAAFRVLVFEPSQARTSWIYTTCGMSSSSVEVPVELHLRSPTEYSGHIELLTVLAHYHGSGHPLTLHSTVNFGRPWLPKSEMTYGLISRPYPEGPSLEECAAAAGMIGCYWVLPITKSERDYKKQYGIEALEALFDNVHIDYLNPLRKSAI
jgi:hypothetical protein